MITAEKCIAQFIGAALLGRICLYHAIIAQNTAINQTPLTLGNGGRREGVVIRRVFNDKYSTHDIRHRYIIDLNRSSGNDTGVNQTNHTITIAHLAEVGIKAWHQG